MKLKFWGETPKPEPKNIPFWKRCVSFIGYILLLIAILGVVLVIASPDKERFSNSYAPEYENDDHTFIWYCPNEDEFGNPDYGHIAILNMPISREDYLDCVESLKLRYPILLQPAPFTMVDPDNKYIQTIKQHIEKETEGYTEYTRALACLYFVQTTIRYASDTDMYHVGDYWCSPTETLYLRQGDCEDTSILLASIYRAFGYECWLVDYPNHIAVTVKIGDSTHYCETTCGKACGFDYCE